MSLTFRAATENDIATIEQLGGEIWRQHYPGIITMEQIEFMLNNRYPAQAILLGMQHGERYFLAYNGAEPVAIADIEDRGEDYFLHKFYVLVAKHRSGIGAQFFKYLLQQAGPAKPVRLQVNRQNYKAINFYFKNGFAIESVGDFNIGGGYYMNDFVMVKGI